MTKTTISLLCASALFLAAGGLSAKERKLKQNEVPKPVLDAVKAKYPGAQLLGFEVDDEDGRTTYEVELKNGATKMDVSALASGKIVEEESTIAMGDVPAAVKKGLAASKYGKWTVKHAEKIVHDEKNDAPSYEFALLLGKDRAEAVFDQAGKLTKDEHDEDDETDED